MGLVAVVVLVLAVLAGTPSVELRAKPASVTAGVPWTATIVVRPPTRLPVTLVARRGAVSRSPHARPAGRGLYRARVVLPSSGRWSLAARVGARTYPPGNDEARTRRWRA
jgi:hypothetical protein